MMLGPTQDRQADQAGWSYPDLSWVNAKKLTNANDNFAPVEMALAA